MSTRESPPREIFIQQLLSPKHLRNVQFRNRHFRNPCFSCCVFYQIAEKASRMPDQEAVSELCVPLRPHLHVHDTPAPSRHRVNLLLNTLRARTENESGNRQEQ